MEFCNPETKGGPSLFSLFVALSDTILAQIVRLQLNRINNRVQARSKNPFEFTEEVVNLKRSRWTESESGGFVTNAILTNTMPPDISWEFLTRMMEGQPVTRVQAGVEEGRFSFGFE